jgi:hypothetical protein
MDANIWPGREAMDAVQKDPLVQEKDPQGRDGRKVTVWWTMGSSLCPNYDRLLPLFGALRRHKSTGEPIGRGLRRFCCVDPRAKVQRHGLMQLSSMLADGISDIHRTGTPSVLTGKFQPKVILAAQL